MSKHKDRDAETTSLGSVKSYFNYGQEMQKNLIITNAMLIKHIARKFFQSNKASLMSGTLVVKEVDSSKLKKFKTKDE